MKPTSRTIVLAVLLFALGTHAYNLPTNAVCRTLIAQSGGLNTFIVKSADGPVWFSAQISELYGYQFRAVSKDGKALGYKELFFIDGDDDSSFDCFPQKTQDDSTCLVSSLQNGISQPFGAKIAPQTVIYGLEPCTTGGSSNFSTQVEVGLYYNGSSLASCTNFQKFASPQTPICTPSGATSAFPFTFALLVTMAIVFVL